MALMTADAERQVQGGGELQGPDYRFILRQRYWGRGSLVHGEKDGVVPFSYGATILSRKMVCFTGREDSPLAVPAS